MSFIIGFSLYFIFNFFFIILYIVKMHKKMRIAGSTTIVFFGIGFISKISFVCFFTQQTFEIDKAPCSCCRFCRRLDNSLLPPSFHISSSFCLCFEYPLIVCQFQLCSFVIATGLFTSWTVSLRCRVINKFSSSVASWF